MPHTETFQAAPRPHIIRLEDRSSLSLTGVEEVGVFQQDGVRLTTSRGKLVIRGENLHMEKFSIESGLVTMTGRIDALIYESAPEKVSFWARLFG